MGDAADSISMPHADVCGNTGIDTHSTHVSAANVAVNAAANVTTAVIATMMASAMAMMTMKTKKTAMAKITTKTKTATTTKIMKMITHNLVGKVVVEPKPVEPVKAPAVGAVTQIHLQLVLLLPLLPLLSKQHSILLQLLNQQLRFE